VTLRMHHYGKVHTPYDICVEVVEDKLTCIGDMAMDRRIANMDDGSYLGSLKAYDALEKNAASTIWLPGHGQPSGQVLQWNRELFEGIYRPCEQAVKDGLPIEAAKAMVLKDERVVSRAKDTKGFDINIGKYVSLAYLEAEAAGF
jgi:glyoxylase-like metal-dependent hydrolase (beta-lactamase superfamily II)